MTKTLWIGLLAAGLAAATGCTPGLHVVRNPGPHASGIRYYRPKPYLFISPATKVTTQGGVTTQALSADVVTIELKYLPDFSEEYALNVRAGLGTNATNITLTDGWNLVAINQTLDTKFADNLKAITELIGTVAPLVKAPGAEAKGAGFLIPPAAAPCQMHARNVPFGYYEAVIGGEGGPGCSLCGPSGVKRLYGWRYVGFAPFVGCPITPAGTEPAICDNGALALYGLVMDNGVMVFKPLPVIGGTDVRCVQPVDPKPAVIPFAASDAANSGTRAAPVVPLGEDPRNK